MGLLEIVKNENNDLKKINDLKKFCEEELGKGAIICNDTPGFLGNRVGVYAMQIAMTEAFKMKLTIEEADAIFGRPMGIPKTGVFGLYDLIGIDLMADVLKSFIKELPQSDPFHIVAKEIPLVKQLIENGYTGRKGKGGFYRMNKSNNKKFLEAINLESNEYSKVKKIVRKNNVKFLVNDYPLIAKKVCADGCHIGQKDMDFVRSRKIVGKNKIIGVTCHNSKKLALKAKKVKANYIAFGSFFKSSTKKSPFKANLATLHWAKKKINMPTVAIGGINDSNYKKI